MIQGGDPTGTGMGGPGYAFNDEFDPNLNFDRAGRLAMANSGPNTNGSQFFITEQPFDSGDGHYVIFGQCDDASVDVVKAIARVPRDSDDRPLTPVVLEKVTIVRQGEPMPPLPVQPGKPRGIHERSRSDDASWRARCAPCAGQIGAPVPPADGGAGGGSHCLRPGCRAAEPSGIEQLTSWACVLAAAAGTRTVVLPMAPASSSRRCVRTGDLRGPVHQPAVGSHPGCGQKPAAAHRSGSDGSGRARAL